MIDLNGLTGLVGTAERLSGWTQICPSVTLIVSELGSGWASDSGHR